MLHSCGNSCTEELKNEQSNSHVSNKILQLSKKKKSRSRQAENQQQSFSNSSDKLLTITEENSSSVDIVLDDIPCVENRHSHQQRFKGLKQIPHTAPWIAQCIHEDKSTTAIGILQAWTHID
jgi:hypothetical protein